MGYKKIKRSNQAKPLGTLYFISKFLTLNAVNSLLQCLKLHEVQVLGGPY